MPAAAAAAAEEDGPPLEAEAAPDALAEPAAAVPQASKHQLALVHSMHSMTELHLK